MSKVVPVAEVEEGTSFAQPAEKRQKTAEKAMCSSIHIAFRNMAGRRLLATTVKVGTTLGELRERLAFAMRVEPCSKVNLVLGERVLPEISSCAFF